MLGAYKVWQLSRRQGQSAPQHVVPKAVFQIR